MTKLLTRDQWALAMLDEAVTIDKERRERTLHSDAIPSWSVESWSVLCITSPPIF
jgi:hypothetical protein